MSMIERCTEVSTYRQPLCIVRFADTEKCFQRIISGNDETSQINEKRPSNIEKDQEEVETDKAEEDINLRNTGLLLKIVESRILGQLSRESVNQFMAYEGFSSLIECR